MTQGISLAAAKIIYKKMVEANKHGQELDPAEIAEADGLWISDEWTHVGMCIVICLDNKKLVQAYRSGQTKVLDTLVGKTIKFANMTVDGELIKELMPLIIAAYSWE
jgi:Asp-tRNA(Asn)/Glu-tRNA(Gln) amidotransferase B subunit